MKFLVLQHVSVEHPGIFRDFMDRDKIRWVTVELDQGESIPELSGFDALIVMGGPMDVWQENEFPWLKEEKSVIRHAITKLKMPFLGFCLGHQLMADALGGTVKPMQSPEIGILDVQLNEQGQNSFLFYGIENNFKTLQWHGAAVTESPPGCQVLAKSEACSIQALQYGTHAFSIQFHIELIESTVSDWGNIPEYAHSLEKSLGKGALVKLALETKQHLSLFNQSAKIIYDNFLKTIDAKNHNQ